MIKFLRFTVFAFSAMMVTSGFQSCSDDKDEPDSPSTVEPDINTVFTHGLPTSVDGAVIVTDDKGQVTKIVDGMETISFQYGKITNGTEFDVLMSSRDSRYPNEGEDIYMKLNKMGFVEYALEIYKGDPDRDEWFFEYNAGGQLTRLRRTEGGDDFKISYTNGDITKVIQTDEDGDTYEFSISYTNASYITPVANKGNLMMFDDFFGIDMDEMGIAYFAGLLGRSTKNLPMGCVEKWMEEGQTFTYSENFNWTFENGFPTEFWTDDYDQYKTTFTWK